MITTAQIGAWLMLVFCGVWAGGILIFAVERTHLWERMPIDQYAVDLRRSLSRVDPMMPILGVVAIIGGLLFAINRAGTPRVLAWCGIALIFLVIVGSIIIAEPINSKFRRLPEGQVPEGAESYRVAWRRFHVWRTLAALGSLVFLAAASVL